MGEQEKGRNKSEKVRVAATRIGVQALNRAKKPMARAILRKLSPEIKARIARNQDTIETVSSIIAMLPPNEGLLGHLTDDFQQGVVNEVIEQCKEENNGVSKKAPRAPTGVAPKGVSDPSPLRRLHIVAAKLPQDQRDKILFWFKGLGPDRQEIFLGVVAESKDDELTALLQLQPIELGAMLELFPKASPTPCAMTPLQLHAAIMNDPQLFLKARTFLFQTGKDEGNFWEAVKRRIGTLEDFRNLMDIDNGSIITTLGLKESFVTKLLNATREGGESQTPNRAKKFRKRAAQRLQNLEQQLDVNPTTTGQRGQS